MLVCLAWLIKIRMPVVAQLLPCNSALLLLPTALLSLPVGLPFILLPLTGMVMAKLTLTDESSGFQTTTQRNANYAAIETALENTLSRNGTGPNAMGANLDMNSHRIINLPAPIASSDAARWVDVASAVGLSTAVPTQTGNGGRVLSTDGTSLTWKNAPVAVDTVADMKALTGFANGAYVCCGGYYTKGDEGGGDFIYNSSSSATQDNGKYITPNTLPGRFIRLMEGDITPHIWGAKGDSTTNDQTAFEACITWIKSAQVATPAMTNVYSTPVMRLIEGKRYLVTGNLDVGIDFHIYANRAVIMSSFYPFVQTTPLFINVNTGCVFDGVGTCGFTDIFRIATGNLDASVILIQNCDIQEWSGVAIKTDTNSASTFLIAQNNRFIGRHTVATNCVSDTKVDFFHFIHNWVEASCETFFINRGSILIEGLCGVPFYSTANDTWVDHLGFDVTLTNCRFGGEPGARTIVRNGTGTGSTNVNRVSITNSQMYCGDFPVCYFTDIPDVFVFTGNNGLTGSYPFEFSTSIPTSTLYTLGSRQSWVVENNQFASILFGQRASTEHGTAACKIELMQNRDKQSGCETYKESQKLLDILYTESGYGPSGSLGAGMSAGTSTDIYAATVQTILGVNGTGNQFNTSFTTLLNGLAAGLYTAVVNVEMKTAKTVAFSLSGGGNKVTQNLGMGAQTISVPFYFDGTNTQAVGYQVENVCTGATFAHGGVRLFSGRVLVKTWNTEALGDAAPTTRYWRLGDRVRRLTPTVGQPKAWVCTVAGTPGTWVSEGNL